MIHEKSASDNAALDALWTERYGSARIISRGRLHDARLLAGFVAREGDALLGAVTYCRLPAEIEVVTLDSVIEGRGAGTALLNAVATVGRDAGVHRLFLITTNDNLRAIEFYKRRGWRLRTVYAGAVDAAREQKPEIPLIGANGIAIHDEIEFELALGPAAAR